MSRIDLVHVNDQVLSRVQDMAILPRKISDHAPLLVRVQISVAPDHQVWRLSRYLISDIRVEPLLAGGSSITMTPLARK